MKKILLLILSLFLITCENPAEAEQENTSWIFVANEGNFGTGQGSISMIDDPVPQDLLLARPAC